jgi:hypothetical protein
MVCNRINALVELYPKAAHDGLVYTGYHMPLGYNLTHPDDLYSMNKKNSCFKWFVTNETVDLGYTQRRLVKVVYILDIIGYNPTHLDDLYRRTERTPAPYTLE